FICRFRWRRYLGRCSASYIRRWQLGIGYGSSAWLITATLFHAALHPGSAHAAKLHARLIYMAAACARCAYTGRACPSLHLPLLHAHTAGAAKFISRPILSPAEGTNHGESL